MGVLSGYEPAKVYEYFELLSSVPRGSGNTRAVADICVEFAKKHGFAYYRDELNNVVITKPGSKGRENEAPVIIQGHLDMVCARHEEDSIDMSKEPVRLMTDGKKIWADRTSLGGDDGIAVAMALAVLDDAELSHSPVEAFFTVDEETGMNGAKGFDYSRLSGRRLLNIDSEEEGVFTVSCAGGIHMTSFIPVTWENGSEEEENFRVEGLPGGHSGGDIAKPGHDNAVILLSKKLKERCDSDLSFRLSSVSGGNFDNAIPDCASAVSGGGKVLDRNSTERVLGFLTEVPNGVQSMSPVFEGLPFTSLSLGICRLEEDGLHTVHLIRSASNAEKEELFEKVRKVSGSFGGSAEAGSSYPAWEYREISPVRDALAAAYRKVTGKEGRIEATHGGLECGLFAEKLDGLDSVSFGPDIFDIHSVNEYMDMDSVARTYAVLIETLKTVR